MGGGSGWIRVRGRGLPSTSRCRRSVRTIENGAPPAERANDVRVDRCRRELLPVRRGGVEGADGAPPPAALATAGEELPCAFAARGARRNASARVPAGE